MTSTTRLISLIVILFCLTTLAHAAQEKPPIPHTAQLWSFADLRAQLDNPNLRILDARPEAVYAEAHIPGAIRVDVAAAEKLAASPGGLTDADAWAAWAAPLGITPETQIIVYDDQRQLAAARIWWVLTYLGVPNAGLLDGGFKLWAASDMPTTKDSTAVEPVPFHVSLRKDRHATRDEVRASLDNPGSQILDARSPAEYTGESKLSKRSGHIPAACNLEWKTLVREDGRFVTLDEARTLLGAAKLDPTKAVITHCQGGGRAAVAAFVLEHLGYRVRNYYESWGDWGNADDTPIEGETKPN